RLRGGAAALVAVDLLAGSRAARRGATAVLRRRDPRQGPAAHHPCRRTRPAPHGRPLPVPRRGRAAGRARLARRLITPAAQRRATARRIHTTLEGDSCRTTRTP